MFNSRLNIYQKRKRQRKLPILAIVMAVPVSLILLELLARLVVGISGKSTELAAYEGEPANANAYRIEFLDQKKQPYQGLSNRGKLAAQRSIAVGYKLVPGQQSNLWRINEQGFRDDIPVPLSKPKDEIRIFVLGGSTAFGQWNPSNEATLAHKLEVRLNQRVAQQKNSPEKYRPQELPFYKPDLRKALALPPQIQGGNYRVINAAVPGYASGNELAQLAIDILPYSPDAIVVLDGYTDLILPSDSQAMDIPRIEEFLSQASGHFWTVVSQRLDDAIADTYLVRAIQYWILRPQLSASELTLMAMDNQVPLAQHVTSDPSELERRVARYRLYHQKMVRLTAAAGIPLIIAIQPEITGRAANSISQPEKAILDELGGEYQKQIALSYQELAKAVSGLERGFPKNTKTLNLYNIYDKVPDRIFLDAIHLTDKGNAILSDRLYQTIAALPKLQIPPSRKLTEKEINGF
ncbi:MAG TPA: GDSL family lipase [Cyanobacteria bacterium UBA11149]|nr:GDSL family lipase [Cyanobacteria bacterium UBA11367]HBE59694.1 GDSL family lipase [Cyanobacteria bacterium UBA11366]HBS70357.1 GDSL family lipase [Cyanobacteria bacterium UBA11153]HBW91432.1 GDSL family lipase [Cyanobacteria bacterium UBA11149]HCA96289.1 GDSL family lipase [Cyanobacteria bacterium UBA9226]